jgi:hypothetical protein
VTGVTARRPPVAYLSAHIAAGRGMRIVVTETGRLSFLHLESHHVSPAVIRCRANGEFVPGAQVQAVGCSRPRAHPEGT